MDNSNKTLNAVADYIASHQILSAHQPVGVALSGGADSVALLDILKRLGYDCIALHCNFHLRGEESNRDQRHAQEITTKLGVKILVAQMDVPAQRKATGESIEMACRTLRYKWFGIMAKQHELQAVAVAHHADDQFETFFLNLLRGSGIKGLAGMKPKNGIIARPLLRLTRSEILDYLSSRNLDFVTDSTNASNEFKRNRLRNELLPRLNELFPGASSSTLNTIEILSAQSQLLDRIVDNLRNEYIADDESINLSQIINNESIPAEVLYEILKPHGFNLSTINDIIRSATESGRTFHGKGKSYLLNRGNLIPLKQRDSQEIQLKWEVIERSELNSLKCQPDTLLLDATALDGKPIWETRRWQEGDRIQPFGMKGSRLLSDIFIDAHLSLKEKQDQWVLTRNGTILWVVGHRASSHYPITTSTTHILRIVKQ